MEKINIKEAIVVEGHYDVERLRGFISSAVIETGGFAVFNDKSIQSMIINFAKKQGIIILTDSDAAGFKIRAFVAQLIPPQQVKHAYIPEISGVEKRKRISSKAGLLGVESVGEEDILKAILSVANKDCENREEFNVALLYTLGLNGKADSATKRRALLEELGLPSRLSTRSMCRLLPYMLTIDQLKAMIR